LVTGCINDYKILFCPLHSVLNKINVFSMNNNNNNIAICKAPYPCTCSRAHTNNNIKAIIVFVNRIKNRNK